MNTHGSLRGISLSGFLQMLKSDKKQSSFLLEILNQKGKRGIIYFHHGELFDALTLNNKAEDAVVEMILWEKVQINIRNQSVKLKKIINTDLLALIAQAANEAPKNDEGTQMINTTPQPTVEDMLSSHNQNIENFDNISSSQTTQHNTNSEHEEDSKVEVNSQIEETNEIKLDSKVEEEEEEEEEKIIAIDDNYQQQPNLAAYEPENQTIKEVVKMALEQLLDVLKGIKGFKAAGIMDFTGDMLAHASTDEKIDLGTVGATFNDIFRSAHEATIDLGLEACNKMTIQTPQGTVVMACSGIDSKVHFHLITIISSDGNQALVKMQFEKIIPKIMKELY